jgi:drug/metabolite transporter (DMT)-like permease
MKKLWGAAAMIAATMIWGGSFSAQSRGVRLVAPVLFTALRSALGALALAVVAALCDRLARRRVTLFGAAETPESRRELLRGGLWCGVFLAVASCLQQYGLKYTTAAKAGFLTTLYIVIVPLLGIFFRRRTSALLWGSAVLALAGAYLLCGGVGSVGRGDVLVILCAFVFSAHILTIDRYAAKCDCVRLSCLQFAVASLLAFAGALAAGEPWVWEKIVAALPYLLYAGIAGSAVAFTLQIVAQKFLHPVTASLLMSLESVFAALGGWIFLQEKLSLREFLGCAVILSAVILSQLPPGSITSRLFSGSSRR